MVCRRLRAAPRRPRSREVFSQEASVRVLAGTRPIDPRGWGHVPNVSTPILPAVGAVLIVIAAVSCAAAPIAGAAATIAALLCLPLLFVVPRGLPVHPLEPLWPFLVCYGITFALKPLLDARGLI